MQLVWHDAYVANATGCNPPVGIKLDALTCKYMNTTNKKSIANLGYQTPVGKFHARDASPPC